MLLRSMLSLLFCILLCGCLGRPVHVIDARQFKLMADRMPHELEARDILDSDRDYLPADWEAVPQRYTERLLKDLPPSVIFDDVVGTQSFASFADSVRKGDTLIKRTNGFTLVQTIKGKRRSTPSVERRLEVDMVAISDWDNDAQKDWIIACKLLRSKGANARIYYVVVPNPPFSGRLPATTVAVYDDMGAFGRLYMRTSEIQRHVPVEDVVPGLRSITVPPTDAPQNPSGNNTGRVQERTLE